MKKFVIHILFGIFLANIETGARLDVFPRVNNAVVVRVGADVAMA